MQIFMNGYSERDFAPDQIIASATFHFHAASYDEALKGGVEKVKNYIKHLTELTDFRSDDFKTRAYSVVERFHTNRIEPKTVDDLDKNLQKRVSDGFFFSQFICLEFDYDKQRLAKLLAISSEDKNAPMLNIDFSLKDVNSKVNELIPAAYEDAKKKAEALASAAGKNLRDCVRVDIDQTAASRDMMYGAPIEKRMSVRGAADDFEQQIKNIDETFKPDDITLSKTISCVWETSN